MSKQTLIIKDKFYLESGDALENFPLVFHTFGTLNDKRDNIIWVCHALTANSNLEEWWHGLFGKDKLFNTDEYFIICLNNLGSPYGTISPITPDVESGQVQDTIFRFLPSEIPRDFTSYCLTN